MKENPINAGKRICIICADEDEKNAERIYNDLKLLGFVPWIASQDVQVGQNIDERFRSVVEKSDYAVVLLSKHSLTQRGAAQKQLKKALDIFQEFPPGEIFLIPVQLDDTEPQEEALSGLRSADFRSLYEKGFKQIIQAIEPEKMDDIDRFPLSFKTDTQSNPLETSNKIIESSGDQRLSFDQKAELIKALLKCSTMLALNSRITVVNNLRDDIRFKIPTGNNAKVDIEHIVTTCNDLSVTYLR